MSSSLLLHPLYQYIFLCRKKKENIFLKIRNTLNFQIKKLYVLIKLHLK